MTMNIDLTSNLLRQSLYSPTEIPEVIMMIPAYYRLYMLLRGEMQDSDSPAIPPTQKGLTVEYGVCRATASAALALLHRDGLVLRSRRGRRKSLQR